MKRPAFQFYPADWRKDVELQSCSIGARGLWLELSCVMHECEPYGHLTLNGAAMPDEKAARLVGVELRDYRALLRELEAAGVSSRTEAGVLFSRRMVRDEAVRNARAAGGEAGAEFGERGRPFGVLGGSPIKTYAYNEPGTLYAVQRTSGGPIKIGVSKAVAQRLSMLRRKVGEIRVLASVKVQDMGATEAATLKRFDGRREGEWINAEWGEVSEAIAQVIGGAITPPLTLPPSSSSSSSPSGEQHGVASQPVGLAPDGKANGAASLEAKAERLRKLATEARAVLAFLNAKAGKRFPETDTNVGIIVARFREGFTPEQVRQVVAMKVRAWGADAEKREFLRPSTLFGREKFSNYVGELVDYPPEVHP